MEAVIAFGGPAHAAFEAWWGPPGHRRADVEYAPLFHPTYPEGSGEPGAMRRMLEQWNGALPGLRAALSERDTQPDTRPYGEKLTPADRAEIPAGDLPAGSPEWMRSLRNWSRRQAVPKPGARPPATREQRAEAERATIVVEIPRADRPWQPLDR